MALPTNYEGTLDEITARYGKELLGRRLNVIALDEPVEAVALKPFYETATSDGWREALRAWAASHDPRTPQLAEEATDRDSIHEDRSE